MGYIKNSYKLVIKDNPSANTLWKGVGDSSLRKIGMANQHMIKKKIPLVIRGMEAQSIMSYS